MNEAQKHIILVVSDGTGGTAEQVTRAALIQFPGVSPTIERRPEVRTRSQVRWPIVDVSGKAVEETAREVLSLVDSGGTTCAS